MDWQIKGNNKKVLIYNEHIIRNRKENAALLKYTSIYLKSY
jgi:hypothetical protein